MGAARFGRSLCGTWMGLLLVACGGSAPEQGGREQVQVSADVQVLMFGNSHSSEELARRLEAMLAAGLGGRTVAVSVAPGWMFLDERAGDAASLSLLRSHRWQAVVLQAQKYSTSGLYDYSTREAEALAAEIRRAGSLPVLFPEWPRRGIDETERIYALHTLIASRAPACVAPVGQAFDLAAQRLPALALHAADGNHAATAGNQLAALVLYGAISAGSPRGLPDLGSGIASATQASLREIAAAVLTSHPPRRWCPTDPPWISPLPAP